MKILYVVNNAGFFCSHRLSLALAAREAGHEVALLTGQAGSPTLEVRALEQLRRLGVLHHVVAFSSGGLAPWTELKGLAQTLAFMRRWQPDLVHCASPKGVLYGSLAARVSNRPALTLAVSGMGSLFAGERSGFAIQTLRRLYLSVAKFGFSHPNCRIIVQNTDDYQLLVEQGLTSPQRLVLIPGSGVALDEFANPAWHTRSDLVVLPARIIREKGVMEFVEAARQLRAGGCRWRFALVGPADYDNPSALDSEQIASWVSDGTIESWGHRDNMVEIFAQAKIVCLPSYREGLPKALLEAAAAGCAVITTDTVGCRESVIPGVSGDLVPVKDAAALTIALKRLIEDPTRQASFGKAGRQLACERFGLEAVTAATLAIYRQLLGSEPLAAT